MGAVDPNTRLGIGVELYVQGITGELPTPTRTGVRFLAILEHASQVLPIPDSTSRTPHLPSGHKHRALTPRMTHHTVTSETIEKEVLGRFDEVVEKAALFSGWDGP